MPTFDPDRPPAEWFSEQVVEARRFFIDAASARSGGVILGGGYERVSEAYTVERRAVPFTVIELVIAGEGEAVLGKNAFRMTPGTLFVYGSRTPHRLATSPRRPLTKYFLDLDGRRASTLLRPLRMGTGQAWQVRQWLDLARLFGEIVHHGGGSGRGRQPVCDALLRALLLHASQSLLPGPDSTQAYDSYQRCCTLIETRFADFRSLDELAGACGQDAAYLCRLFKRFDHESPYRRLLRKRMSFAAAQLCECDMTIRDVAAGMGYADPFHFSRAFKTTLGASPKTFRVLHGRLTPAGP